MQRYIGKIENEHIILEKDDIFHIVKVMRMHKGDYFDVLIPNSGVYLCQINNNEQFDFSIVKKIEENHEVDGYIRLLYCIPKGEKLDFVIQKSVELGADEIVLVNSSRCVRKLDKSNISNKLVRFNKIIKEATEQCKREKVLKLTDIIDFSDIGKYQADVKLIPYENTKESVYNLSNKLNNVRGKVVNVIVGCEGGFSEDEVSYAKKNGFEEISLGKRILRSETSCIYILSLLSFYMEN